MSSIWNWTRFLYGYILWNIMGARTISDGAAHRTYDDPDRPPWLRGGWYDLLWKAVGNTGWGVPVAANNFVAISDSDGNVPTFSLTPIGIVLKFFSQTLVVDSPPAKARIVITIVFLNSKHQTIRYYEETNYVYEGIVGEGTLLEHSIPLPPGAVEFGITTITNYSAVDAEVEIITRMPVDPIDCLRPGE